MDFLRPIGSYFELYFVFLMPSDRLVGLFTGSPEGSQGTSAYDKTRRKEIAKEAKETIRNVEMHNPDFSESITISGGKINEWLNQPFGNRMEYLEKNEMLLDLPNVLANSKYLGDGTDKHDERVKCTCSRLNAEILMRG